MSTRTGLFITFEGGEGCGKSTQAKILYRKMQEADIPCILTQEPGGTPLGNEVRDLLKTKRPLNIYPKTELLLFAACRAQIVTEVIQPSLDSGKTVICDRFADSTTVYQGFGRGLDLNLIQNINDLATHGLKPDLTILLDMRPQISLQRKSNRMNDRFDTEDILFHQKVREGYLELAKQDPARWLTIDGKQPVDTISLLIWQKVNGLLQPGKQT
ncbi:MAG: dTMP kinase [Dehalococcoidia bacterium]|nr:dTMP kinase [Dehalococcoidia bacterium]MDD5494028.1 dTMP kinase [Dehalococcoidia bacterium]